MDIEEFKQHKKTMANNIAGAISKETAAFREKTGYMPHTIWVELTEVTLISDKQRRYAVTNVSTDVEI